MTKLPGLSTDIEPSRAEAKSALEEAARFNPKFKFTDRKCADALDPSRAVPVLGGGDHPGRTHRRAADPPFREGSKVNIYFIAVLFAVLMLVTYVPAVPMGLVELFYG